MNPFKKPTKQLSVFLTAGYPTLHSLKDQLKLLQGTGVDFIEIGIPFSDPIADGPIIQESSHVALKNGMNLEVLFNQLNEFKTTVTIPIVLMGYFNSVLQFGITRFLEEAARCEIKGIILPDLPFEIYVRSYQKVFEEYGLSYIPLITPRSTDEFIKTVAQHCSNGFIYLISQHTTTGNEINFNTLHDRYSEIRKLCGDTPLFIGFGIRTAEDLSTCFRYADGGIVGSAYIQAMAKARESELLKSFKQAVACVE